VIEGQLHNKKILLIGDTGSGISIIGGNYFDRNLSQFKVKPSKSKPVAANGEELDLRGEATVPITIGKETVDHDFKIIEDLNDQVLVGNDLFKKMALIFDFYREIITDRNGYSIAMNIWKAKEEAQQDSDEITLLYDVKIPARCATIIKACVKSTQKDKLKEIYTPFELLMKNRCYIPPGIIDNNTEINLEIRNLSTKAVKLKEGRTIARVLNNKKDAIYIIDRSTTNNIGKKQEEIQEEDRKKVYELIDALDISRNSTLTENQVWQLKEFLKKNYKVFATNTSSPNRTPYVKHSINTREVEPIRQRARRFSHMEQQLEKQYIDEMLKNGIISKSKSPWAAPIVMVNKPDGSKRFCVDYRKLNMVTVKDRYPLPRIDETIDKLKGMNHISTLDLASGFWQIPMDEKDKEKTAFISTYGLYEWNVMPFGLCNAPATFQRMMDEVCEGLEWKVGSDYIDDIVIGSTTFEEHLRSLQNLFNRLQEYGLTIKIQKCKFCQQELVFLGHLVSKDGIRPNPAKTKIIEELRPPTDLKGLRRFLGVTGYYRRFVQDYSKIANPLTRLLKKGNIYRWTEDCQEAFKTLKKILISAPILKYPDFEQPFILKTDASTKALGAVLCQEIEGKNHIIAYWSKTLSETQRKYTITELECLAVIDAIHHFRHYLGGGVRFTVQTDHQALKWLMNNDHVMTNRLERWKLKLMPLNMEIQYRPGKTNVEADLLSRIKNGKIFLIQDRKQKKYSEAEREEILRINEKEQRKYLPVKIPSLEPGARLAKEQREDPDFQHIYLYLSERKLPDNEKLKELVEKNAPKFKLDDMVLFRIDLTQRMKARGLTKARLAVPKAYREEILELCHNSLLAGHLGTNKTYKRIQHEYYWPKLTRDVRTWINTCIECNIKKGKPKEATGYRSRTTASEPLEVIACDVIGPLPETQEKNRYILVFTDQFTRYAEAFAINKQNAETIADTFVRNYCCRYGIPKKFVSDRGKQLIGQIMTSIHNRLGIQQLTTSSYRPQGNAIAERFNKTLIGILTMFVSDHQKDWDYLLPFAVFAYNTSVHDSLNETPYYLMYVRDPNNPVTFGEDQFKQYQQSIPEYCRERTSTRNKIEDQIRYYNELVLQKKARTKEDEPTRELTTGDLVWVYVKPIVEDKKTKKFATSWTGPYRIVLIISNSQIIVKDIYSKKLKAVHISRLKKVKDARKPIKEAKEPRQNPTNLESYEVEKVIDDRVDNKGQKYFKVRWKGYPPTEDDWVKEQDMDCQDLVTEYYRRIGLDNQGKRRNYE